MSDNNSPTNSQVSAGQALLDQTNNETTRLQSLHDDIPAEILAQLTDKATGDEKNGIDTSLASTDSSEISGENPEDDPEDKATDESPDEEEAAAATKPKEQETKEQRQASRLAELVKRESRLRDERHSFKQERDEWLKWLEQEQAHVAGAKEFRQLMKTDLIKAIKLAGFDLDAAADAFLVATNPDNRGRPIGVEPSQKVVHNDRLAALEQKLAAYEAKENERLQQQKQTQHQQAHQEVMQHFSSRLTDDAGTRWPNLADHLDGDRLVFREADKVFDRLYPNPRQGDLEHFLENQVDDVFDFVEQKLADRRAARRRSGTSTDTQKGQTQQQVGTKAGGPKTLSNRLGASPVGTKKSTKEMTDDELALYLVSQMK